MKKIIIVLLALLMLTSCVQDKTEIKSTDSNTSNENTIRESTDSTAAYYLDLLYNYEVKDKNSSNTAENKEFEDYLNQIFLDTLEDDYMYMHYNISDYQALGITKPEASWGEISYDASEDIKEYEEELEELREFDYDSLSYREQYYYDMYEYSLLETIVQLYFSHYETLFSEGNDMLNNIVVSLDEFKLNNEEYVEDYLLILADTDRYMDDLLVYTATQAENGIYTSDDSLDYSIDYADSFASKKEDNALITSFNTRIEDVEGLSEEAKEKYKEENKEIVLNEVIPAFEKASSELENYKGKLDSDKERLCDIDIDYAKSVYLLNTSSNKSIDELFNDGQEEMITILYNFITAINDEDAYNEYVSFYEESDSPCFGLSDEETLDYLKEHIKGHYPEMEDIQYSISRLDASAASDSTVAYYVSPQLDALDQNVIRTNPNAMGNDVIDDYMVLAHEGIPGHMYQNAYYQSTNPNRFTSTQGFIGYTEGYACYAMMSAFDYASIENENARYIIDFACMYFYLLQSLCDIGVNVYGWDKDKLEDYLSDYYPYELDDSTVDSIYSSAIMRPGVLVSYGLGYAEFMQLRRDTEEAMGSQFNEEEYNKVLLDEGPLPLCILADKVDDYVGK